MSETVGIVTYNRPDSLGRLLESLSKQTVVPAEIAVVDDGESAETRTVIEDYEPTFDDLGTTFTYVRRTSSNTIQQGARNRIIGEAEGDTICFLDDDTVCRSDWLESLRAGFEDHDVAGVGGPAIKARPDLSPVDDCIRDGENRNTVSEYGSVTEISGRWVPPDPVPTEVFRGANMAFRKRALEDVGGFDVRFRGSAAFEEWDVMTRIRQSGGRLLYHPDAFVYHIEVDAGGSRDSGKLDRPPSYWYAHNSVLYRRKNFPGAYRLGLLRLLVRQQQNGLPPVAARLWRLLLGNTGERHWLRGYWDGVRGARVG